MKNALKSLFIVMSCLVASLAWAATPAVTITASSSVIGDWNKTYNAGTATEIKLSVTGAAIASKKPCQATTNESVLSISSSDTHYLTFELPQNSSATIDSILFRASGNSSGTSDWFSPLFSCPETTFNTSNITGVFDVHFTGYDHACTDVMAKLVKNTKSCRFYRRVKYTAGNPGSLGSGSNYGSGQTTNITYIEIYISGGTPSGPVAVTGVTLSPTTLTLEAGQTGSLTATVQPTNADNKNVTWSSSNTSVATVDANGVVSAVGAGTATITVTTEDGSKTATCAVTVTAPAAPIPVTAIALSDASVAVGGTTTLTVTYTPADANTGKAITSWTSSNTAVATVANGVVNGVSSGTAIITATTEGGKSATCTVTVTVVNVTGVSLNKSSVNLQVGGSETLTASVLPDNASNKNVSWSSSDNTVATVNNGNVTGVKAGTATITVTTEDGNKTATCAVTVTAGPPVPSTDLTLHEPEVYEAKEMAGGYNTPLTIVNGREYEVYYTIKGKINGSSVATVSATPSGAYLTDASSKANDGWFNGNPGSMEESGTTAADEFATSVGNWKMKNNEKLELHVKGYDEFAILAADNNASDANKQFHIFLNGKDVTPTPHSTTPTVRRITLTASQEYILRVEAYGSSQMKFYGFSFRVAQQPRTRYLKGNDSTQTVLQTDAVKAVTYVTKYNNLEGAETKLEWLGPQATGITLTPVPTAPGSLTDTLVLSGNANCPTGIYNYAVVAKYNGVETSRATGKFKVISDIKTLSTSTSAKVYQNEEMDQIIFKYYALDASAVKLTWTNQTPAGITGQGTTPGKYVIGGTPTTIGTYPYSITVTGADTTITGSIEVAELNYGNDPILYLYKNDNADLRDGIYQFLTSQAGGNRNLISRRAKTDGKRPADQYAKYKWILISEDVDADNAEILAAARGEVNLPVLNMKSFSYTPGRLNWGEPDNGSLTEKGRFITVVRDDHPIFKALNKNNGDSIQVLDKIESKGLMPIDVNYSGTLCLATALTRDIEDYNADGPAKTFLHEVPAASRPNKQKYICLPISTDGSNHLHAEGKRLITETIKYLLSNEASIMAPSLAITDFRIGDYIGKIDEDSRLITIDVLEKDSDAMKTASPKITLASPLTFVTPDKHCVNADGTVDFSNWHYGVKYVVSDYASKHYYDVIVRLYTPQGIENIEAGTWINIFDIYGRKVATTNEDIRSVDLPRGMYVVVTESGQTLKIMK